MCRTETLALSGVKLVRSVAAQWRQVRHPKRSRPRCPIGGGALGGGYDVLEADTTSICATGSRRFLLCHRQVLPTSISRDRWRWSYVSRLLAGPTAAVSSLRALGATLHVCIHRQSTLSTSFPTMTRKHEETPGASFLGRGVLGSLVGNSAN